MSKDTNQLVENLLRREFDSYSLIDLIYLGEGKRLIKAARELGLYRLARQMYDDLNCELLKYNYHE